MRAGCGGCAGVVGGMVCEEVLAQHLQPLHGLSMRPLAQHPRVQVLEGEKRIVRQRKEMVQESERGRLFIKTG